MMSYGKWLAKAAVGNGSPRLQSAAIRFSSKAMRRTFIITLLLTTPWWASAQSESEPYAEAIAAIKAVQNEGVGNENASVAWQELSRSDASLVVPLLESMSDASGLAANWLVSAAQTIVDRELANDTPLPLAAIGAFLMDTRQSPRARRWAFEVIQRVEPDTAAKLVPGMLNDPSTELRRDAIAGLLVEAEALVNADKTQSASIIYRQALGAARDVDQIDAASKALSELGEDVDLAQRFGFLMHWSVIGPFDNTDRAGFDTVFPPETEIDLAARMMKAKRGKCAGQISPPLTPMAWWISTNLMGHERSHGLRIHGVASASDQPAELRLGCKNGWKIWLNGELVFGRDEYHRGMSIDRFKLPITLKKGKNTLLVKLCQNEQTEDWTVEWQFRIASLRCDWHRTAGS